MYRKFLRADGFSVVESLLAVLIMLVALLSLAQLLGFSIIVNKNQGKDATKATAFTHDKMEELNNLAFTDTTTNLTVNPPYPATGSGLTAGGSISPNAAVANYVDYLDQNGVRMVATGSAFTRQWRITNETATLKRFDVSVTSNRSFSFGSVPATFVVTYKSN